MTGRRLIAGVMGSGSHPHEALAGPLGTLLAESGFHLLTGGGDGVMASVARAFCRVRPRPGLSIGVIRSAEAPAADPETGRRLYRPGSRNPWVEIPIFTHLPLSGAQGRDFMSRNHINVLSSDVLFALPGSAGTLSEVRLRLEYGRPVILFLGPETLDGKRQEQIRSACANPSLLLAAETLAGVPRRIERSLESHRRAA